MFVLLAAVLLAAPPGEVSPVTFAQAVSLASGTPGAQSAVRAAELQRAEQARLSGLGLNPQLVVEPGYRQREAERGLDLRLGVSQGLNLSGQRPARDRALDAEQCLLQTEARAVLLARRLAIAEAGLLSWAAEVAREPGAEDVRALAPPEVSMLEVELRPLDAARLGLSVREVLEAVQAVRTGLQLGATYDGAVRVPIVLRLAGTEGVFSLAHLPLLGSPLEKTVRPFAPIAELFAADGQRLAVYPAASEGGVGGDPQAHPPGALPLFETVRSEDGVHAPAHAGRPVALGPRVHPALVRAAGAARRDGTGLRLGDAGGGGAAGRGALHPADVAGAVAVGRLTRPRGLIGQMREGILHREDEVAEVARCTRPRRG